MFDVHKRLEELKTSFDYYMAIYPELRTQPNKNAEAELILNIINVIQNELRNLSQEIRDMELENGLNPTISEIEHSEEQPLNR